LIFERTRDMADNMETNEEYLSFFVYNHHICDKIMADFYQNAEREERIIDIMIHLIEIYELVQLSPMDLS